MMDGPEPEASATPQPAPELPHDPETRSEDHGSTVVANDFPLEDLVSDLERDPCECWRAYDGLQSLDEETRLRIVEGLAALAPGPGVMGLLELIAAERDAPAAAAERAMEQWKAIHPGSVAFIWASNLAARDDSVSCWTIDRRLHQDDGAEAEPWPADRRSPRLRNCHVTAVDGEGRGVVGLSTTSGDQRVTALFLCDVTRGVLGAIGTTENESAAAGGLLRDFQENHQGPGQEFPGELALGLLAGALVLNGTTVPESVSTWMEAAIGEMLPPRAFPVYRIEEDQPEEPTVLLHRAEQIFDACPAWLDTSALTFELAEEIVLREGRTSVDPHRDSGAFRFLFEHRIIQRLEQYSRMLLWMCRYWDQSGNPVLARSAQSFAVQLADEQNAVPAHPFAIALTAQSLNAAQELLGTRHDPRGDRPQRQTRGVGRVKRDEEDG